jgi:hypothetical protein
MTNYEKLVKALRCKRDDCEGCDLAFLDNDEGWICQYAAKDDDAADAIEALLKENKELIEDRPEMVEADGHWEWRKPNGEVMMPKRGEIVRCGECRYRITAHGISDGWVLCSKPYTERGNAMHRADWFCADGEREVQG